MNLFTNLKLSLLKIKWNVELERIVKEKQLPGVQHIWDLPQYCLNSEWRIKSEHSVQSWNLDNTTVFGHYMIPILQFDFRLIVKNE